MSKIKFVQIAYGESMSDCDSSSGLYALDSEGRVWKYESQFKYSPENKITERKFWEMLEDPNVPTEELSETDIF